MKTNKFQITFNSNLTESQEDYLFVNLKNIIDSFADYNCIDIKDLTITSSFSDTLEMNREPSGLKDMLIIKKSHIQTEIIPLFKCSNCKEEFENECGFENEDRLICRNCYEEIEEDESNESLENKCEWCGANWTEGEECNEMSHYINR